jgi:hypothetical protein
MGDCGNRVMLLDSISLINDEGISPGGSYPIEIK